MSARAPVTARPAIVPDHLPANAGGHPAPLSVNTVLRAPGRPLDQDTRKGMERRLGHSFAEVRVHAGPEAATSARQAGAEAYTVGRDIVFGEANFSPRTPRGADLLAHESRHTAENDPRTLRRFESPEHEDLGDAAFKQLNAFLQTDEGSDWVAKYKLDPKLPAQVSKDIMLVGGTILVGDKRLTPGQIIALMGDFFRTVDDLKKASPIEVQRLLAAIDKERKGELSNPNAEYQSITAEYRDKKDTYLELAKENKPHFTPTNREAWKKLHKQAIDKAVQSRSVKSQPNPGLEDAKLYDAAGGHFLTDAFSSGHLFNIDELMTAIDLYLRANPAAPANPEMTAYYALVESQKAMPQLVLKNVHDHFNTVGFSVRNKKGMQWTLFGDNNLKKSPDTQRIAALAVFISRQQIIRAAKGETIDETMYNEVLDLLPDEDSVKQMTEQAEKFIPEAARTLSLLFYRQRLAGGAGLKSLLGGGAFGSIASSIITSNLTTVSDPGREKQLLDLKDRADELKTPLVAPQFTVFSFK